MVIYDRKISLRLAPYITLISITQLWFKLSTLGISLKTFWFTIQWQSWQANIVSDQINQLESWKRVDIVLGSNKEFLSLRRKLTVQGAAQHQCDQIVFLIFGHLLSWKFAQKHSNCAKVSWKFCPKPNKPYCQRFLNICQSGGISPNLVTLLWTSWRSSYWFLLGINE